MILDQLTSVHKPSDLADTKKLNITRRDVLQMGTVGLLSMATPLLAGKKAQAASPKMWQVSFRQAHTGESFSGVYRVGDQYLPDVFERLNYMLRDFRTGEAFPMDPRVIDVISMVQQGTGKDAPLEILSGYRTPKTNAMLYRISEGVARNSYHMYGQAIDIRMPGYSTKKLSQVARGLRAGGVGYYPKSHFVHVDTGEIRTW